MRILFIFWRIFACSHSCDLLRLLARSADAFAREVELEVTRLRVALPAGLDGRREVLALLASPVERLCFGEEREEAIEEAS